MDIVGMLERTPVFSQLTKRDLTALAQTARQRRYAAGDVIVKEGSDAIGCFIVASGEVEVVKGLDSPDQEVLATLGPGDFFGEMAIIDDAPRSATVRAIKETECIAITRWDFMAEVRTRPDIAIQMLPVLVKRIRAAEGGSQEEHHSLRDRKELAMYPN